MSELDDLVISIAKSVKSYRAGEIAEPTPEHVERWSRQFTPANVLPFLREFDHVIRQTFLTEELIKKFLKGLVTNTALTGDNNKTFWQSANVLTIQKKGQSQREMVKLFANELREICGLELTQCGAFGGDYIYLDDILFTGGRIGSDIQHWIENQAPSKANVHIILAAMFTGGHFYLESNRLKKSIERSGKKITIKFWRAVSLENRLYYNYTSDVLWPTIIPMDQIIQEHVDVAAKLRTPGGKTKFFSSESARQILESEFLLAGAKIRSLTAAPSDFNRPLGCGNFGLGFGSMLTTYRNCPNNCPLAVWWGDPKVESGALNWYPLLPRITYAAPENIFNGFNAL